MLRNFLNENEYVPWDSMMFMTGHINYGGRVTDDLDRLLLLAILNKYYTPEILQDGYKFSPSGKYFAPNFESLQEYRKFIDLLPSTDEPEIFGMHENANLAFKRIESMKILSIILDIQPRITQSSDGKSGDDIVMEQITEIQEMQLQLIDPND